MKIIFMTILRSPIKIRILRAPNLFQYLHHSTNREMEKSHLEKSNIYGAPARMWKMPLKNMLFTHNKSATLSIN